MSLYPRRVIHTTRNKPRYATQLPGQYTYSLKPQQYGQCEMYVTGRQTYEYIHKIIFHTVHIVSHNIPSSPITILIILHTVINNLPHCTIISHTVHHLSQCTIISHTVPSSATLYHHFPYFHNVVHLKLQPCTQLYLYIVIYYLPILYWHKGRIVSEHLISTSLAVPLTLYIARQFSVSELLLRHDLSSRFVVFEPSSHLNNPSLGSFVAPTYTFVCPGSSLKQI